MTREQQATGLRRWREGRGLTQLNAGTVYGVTANTWWRWEAAIHPVPRWMQIVVDADAARSDLPHVTAAEVRALRRCGLLRRTLKMYRLLWPDSTDGSRLVQQHRFHIDAARSWRDTHTPEETP